VNVFVTETCV